jgi:hypothetical protein
MEMALLIENKSHGETEKRIVSNYNKIKFASARSFRRSERARDGKIFSLFIIKTDTFLLLRLCLLSPVVRELYRSTLCHGNQGEWRRENFCRWR